MKAKITNAIFAICLSLFTQSALAQIVLSIEEPAPNSTYSGVANIRGFAVGVNGIERIELIVEALLHK